MKETSNFAPVTNGTAQGSALWAVLTIVYLYDIDIGLSSFIGKFADYKKVGNSIISNHDRHSLHEDFYNISVWSKRWKMRFNADKCHIFSVGTRNQNY